MVQELLDALGLEPNKATFERIAVELSALAGKSPPWSWRYVRSAHAGDYAPSKKMLNAVGAMLAELDGGSAELAAAVPVTCYVPPGQAAEFAGAYVMGSVRLCEECNKRFSPNVPWRRFCGECRPVQKDLTIPDLPP